MSDTKQIKILKDTVCGCKRVKAGDIVTAGAADARLLITLHKAEEVKPEGVKPEDLGQADKSGQAGKSGLTGDAAGKGGEAAADSGK